MHSSSIFEGQDKFFSFYGTHFNIYQVQVIYSVENDISEVINFMEVKNQYQEDNNIQKEDIANILFCQL